MSNVWSDICLSACDKSPKEVLRLLAAVQVSKIAFSRLLISRYFNANIF